MIQIESISIGEIRGVRDLKLDLACKTLVISGPNGSGKSGIVDGIEFALTGDMSRLGGKGTAGLSVQRHGPHVDRRDDPASAKVILQVRLIDLGKSVTVTRDIGNPKIVTLDPDEIEIRAELDEVSRHPELVLSRREIIKYVVAEAGERARHVQALLRLDGIGELRATIGTALNKTRSTHQAAKENTTSAMAAFGRHLDLEAPAPQEILRVINERRRILGLVELDDFSANVKLDRDVQAGGLNTPFNKVSALADIAALQTALQGIEAATAAETATMLEGTQALQADPGLLRLVQLHGLVETGLSLVDSELCPLCDTKWSDIEALKEHLSAKLQKSAQAAELRHRLQQQAQSLARHITRLTNLARTVIPLADGFNGGLSTTLAAWLEDLQAFSGRIQTLEGMIGEAERFERSWINAPSNLGDNVAALAAQVQASPDQTASANAQTFLALAQDRLDTYRRARKTEEAAGHAVLAAEAAYESYCQESEAVLRRLYEAVEADFTEFYRLINSGDEPTFKVMFTPQQGKLDLSVDFYGKGMFPPAAYHSEGHQDGMGVCLYLALMKNLLGARFRFSVLDDVVMSVDRGHRKQFCRLLKEHFPDTQFIITTHDPIWARQMRSAGLVDTHSMVEFHGWSVETGPIHTEAIDIWDQIDNDMAKDDIPLAAARLRRHLEWVCGELANALGAPVAYRADADYDLGDLFSAVVGRHGDLLKRAANAANSWGNDTAKIQINSLKEDRAKALAAYGGENWIVNKAVHYNEWADFSVADFQPLVGAVRALLLQFQCSTCKGWLYVTPSKGEAEALRCDCDAIHLNLKRKA